MDELKDSLLSKKIYGYQYKIIFYRNLLARICTLYYVCLEGILTGIWSISLADIQDKLNLSDSILGITAMIANMGTVATLPITNYCLIHFGCKLTVIIGGFFYSVFLLFIALSDTLGLLMFSMFIYGLMWGTTDIAGNNSAIITGILYYIIILLVYIE